MDINKYKEIAKYTEQEECLGQIESIESILEKNNFLLSLVGQFSTGKSRLINNLLGMELLPVHITETTQVATFIKFNEENNARIYLNNGTILDVEIQDVKEVWEGKKSGYEGKINYIEVGINSSFLKDGLILGDTPGINTTIKRHEEETRKILKMSQACMYVISKPVSDVDKIFIKELLDSGLKVICVRTHMDSINKSEENIEFSITKDREKIMEVSEDRIEEIYHVSNERDSEWYDKINEIKRYLEFSLGPNINSEIKESCENRVTIIANNLSKALEERKSLLEDMSNNKKSKLDQKRLENERNRNKLEANLEIKRSSYKRNIEEIKRVAKKIVNEKVINIEKQFKNKLDYLEYSPEAEMRLKQSVDDVLYDSSKILKEDYIEKFNEFIKQNYEELLDGIEVFNNNISNLESNIPHDLVSLIRENEKRDHTVEKIKTRLEGLSERIEEKTLEIEKSNYNSEVYNQKQKELEELKNIACEEMKEYGAYVPKYIEVEGNNTVSQVMKKVGSIADWGLMFLPPAAYAGIASKIGKGGATAVKIGKTLGEVDKAKDLFFVLKGIGDTIKNVTKKTEIGKNRDKKVMMMVEKSKEVVIKSKEVASQVGMLDYLTLEFWGEKIGSQFDQAPKMMIDREYEIEYKKERERIANEITRTQRKEMEMLKEYNILKNNEERIKKEKEFEEKKLKELANELKKKEREIRSNSEKKAFSVLKEQYLNEFNRMLEDLANTLIKKCDEVLKKPIENYFDISLSSIKYELEKYCELNEKMRSEYLELNEGELKLEYDKCLKYLDIIKRK